MRGHIGDRALQGVVVTEVVASSPAESAGIVPGDVITSFAAKPVDSVGALLENVSQTKPGDVVKVTYIRDSKRLASDVRISPFLSEYLRAQAPVPRASAEDVGARIEDIKMEIERLKADLKDLESRRR
jgi:C-terminal processing protease CtpA/Prc